MQYLLMAGLITNVETRFVLGEEISQKWYRNLKKQKEQKEKEEQNLFLYVYRQFFRFRIFQCIYIVY